MDVIPISGIRGDSLSVPRRTEGIAALRFDLTPVAPGGEQRHGSHRHFSGEELPYEDAEFIEIVEDDPEPVEIAPEVPIGRHIYFVA